MTHLIASIIAAGGIAFAIAGPGAGSCDSKKSTDTAKACDTEKSCDTTQVASNDKACDGDKKACDTTEVASKDKACDADKACDTDKAAKTTQVADSGDKKDGACCPLMESKGGAVTAAAATTEGAAASAYDTAAWPEYNTDLYAKDVQGKELPTPLGSEEWLTDKVETENKVVVLDFWATWCGPCRAASPKLDKLQKAHADKLAVLAIAGQNDPIENVRSYVEEHPVSYSHLYDDDQSVFKPLESKGIPLVVVMSTDGVVRWMGNPHEEDFTTAVEKVIKADPAIKTTEG